jgi:hypothetical protein
MRDIEDDLRRERRKRMLARGGPTEYQDPEVFAAVERVLRRAVDERDPDVLLLNELIGSDPERRLGLPLKFSSHRAALGPAILFVKRRVLLPLTRWLYEYSLENFRRQERINRLLFACVEELAIENGRLRREIAGLQDCREGRGGRDQGVE